MQVGVYLLPLLPPLDGMQAYHWVTPGIKFTGTHLYLDGERLCESEGLLPKSTRQCPQPGLGPRPLNQESHPLTMRPSQLNASQDKHYMPSSVSETKISCQMVLYSPAVNLVASFDSSLYTFKFWEVWSTLRVSELWTMSASLHIWPKQEREINTVSISGFHK